MYRLKLIFYAVKLFNVQLLNFCNVKFLTKSQHIALQMLLSFLATFVLEKCLMVDWPLCTCADNGVSVCKNALQYSESQFVGMDP